jgi:hypothetical protein
MSPKAVSTQQQRAAGHAALASRDHLLRQGILRLLAIKDSDVRMLTLEQWIRGYTQAARSRR